MQASIVIVKKRVVGDRLPDPHRSHPHKVFTFLVADRSSEISRVPPTISAPFCREQSCLLSRQSNTARFDRSPQLDNGAGAGVVASTMTRAQGSSRWVPCAKAHSSARTTCSPIFRRGYIREVSRLKLLSRFCALGRLNQSRVQSQDERRQSSAGKGTGVFSVRFFQRIHDRSCQFWQCSQLSP